VEAVVFLVVAAVRLVIVKPPVRELLLVALAVHTAVAVERRVEKDNLLPPLALLFRALAVLVWFYWHGQRGINMKYAWIENGKIRDIAPGNPSDWYHPDVAKFYDTSVPDNAAKDDFWDGTAATRPVVPSYVDSPKVHQWVSEDIRKSLTLVERVKWDNDTSNEIKTAKIELTGMSYKAKVKAVLDMLVASGDVSQMSADAILAQTGDNTIPSTIT